MTSNPAEQTLSSTLDFQGYERLRAKARQDEEGALRETAQQFEALFIQMMMKSMRSTVARSELFDSSAIRTFESMQDQELSKEMARSGGIGLADMLVEQLSANRQAGLTSGFGADGSGRSLPLDAASPTALQIERGLRAYKLPEANPGYPLNNRANLPIK